MEGEALPTQPLSSESGLSKNGTPEPTSAEKKPEQNRTSRKEASFKLRDAGDIIREHLDQGFFGREGEDKYTEAQTALLYKGTGGSSTKEASLQLQAMIASVREIAGKDPQAQELNSYFTKNIKVFNQADGETYSLNDWEEQINAIQNDNSLSGEQKESKARELVEKAFYGFLFQKEEVKAQEQPKSQENRLIDDSIGKIKEEIARLKAAGQDAKDKEAVLRSLELANNAKGELGIFFKADALQRLKASGVEGINREEEDRALEELNPRLERAGDTLKTHLEKYGISREQQRQLMEIVKNGDMEKLIINEHFNKIKDLDKLIFGKEVPEQELLQKLSGQEKALYLFNKYGKKGLMGVLLALLLGIVQAADLAKGEIVAR